MNESAGSRRCDIIIIIVVAIIITGGWDAGTNTQA
jgi:hypothetical protein